LAVVGVSGGVVIIFVAPLASVRRIVIIAVVASCTVVGNVFVGAIQHVEIIVNSEGGRAPTGIGCMAGCTIGRQ